MNHWLSLVCCWTVLVIALPGLARGQCAITGPGNVDERAPFTLCGPMGYTYRWTGPGVQTSSTQRCVRIGGLTSGLYEYRLSIYTSGALQGRCVSTVTVGEAPNPAGEDECVVEGPTTLESGTTVELCGQPTSDANLHTYLWTGPDGFRATTQCIRVSREGLYQLTTRNRLTGHERQCTHQLVLQGRGSTECAIQGPDLFPASGRARLCGPAGAATYRWRGPGGFTSTNRCVDVTRVGTYSLRIQDRYGEVAECSRVLDTDEGPGDADEPFVDNCPRNYMFWAIACRDRRELSAEELRAVASCVDEQSAALNWPNDLDGFCQTLRPARKMTQRIQAARQLATLLANICAASRGVTSASGTPIGLDPDTPVSFSSARTVGELAALADRLVSRGRGNFASLNKYLHAVNSGRGIGEVCQ